MTPTGDQLYGNLIPALGSITNTFSAHLTGHAQRGGPGLVLAQDNTLGSFSPYEGRIYAAFVGYYNVKIAGYQNPATNTDVFLEYSDDAGRSWNFAGAVNNLRLPGGRLIGIAGQPVLSRPGHGPHAVHAGDRGQPGDRYGGPELSRRRYDASNARVATDVVTSIDGGNTWSPVTYANPQNTAVERHHRQDGRPRPHDRQPVGRRRPARRPLTATATRWAWPSYDGHVYSIWAGNFNQSSIVNGTVTGDPLNIWLRTMVIAAGPRVISSTMGPWPPRP